MLQVQCGKISDDVNSFLYDFLLVSDEARVDDAQTVSRLYLTVSSCRSKAIGKNDSIVLWSFRIVGFVKVLRSVHQLLSFLILLVNFVHPPGKIVGVLLMSNSFEMVSRVLTRRWRLLALSKLLPTGKSSRERIYRRSINLRIHRSIDQRHQRFTDSKQWIHLALETKISVFVVDLLSRASHQFITLHQLRHDRTHSNEGRSVQNFRYWSQIKLPCCGGESVNEAWDYLWHRRENSDYRVIDFKEMWKDTNREKRSWMVKDKLIRGC